MSKIETIQVENQESIAARQDSALRRIVRVVGLTLLWSFISALIVGSFAAAIWTIIPTELLQWGAGEMNLIGYVSHCSFVPISTLSLVVMGSIGLLFAFKFNRSRRMGMGVFVGTAGGLAIGALGGVDIIMFIGMGAGVGIGTIFGLIIGFVSQA